MKFVQKSLGKAPAVSSAQCSVWRDYLRITLILFSIFILINILIYIAVEITVRNMSVEQEVSLFSTLREGLFETSAESEIPAVFVEVLEKIRTHPEVTPYPYQLVRIEEKEPNAFAIPGGAIGITDGLIEMIEDDVIGIAFLLGHELGHFHNRDHLRGAGRALLLSSCQDILFGGDVLGGVSYGAVITAYSQQQEKKADCFGLQLVYDCYGKTEGATQLLRKLGETQGIPEWAYMFATHPGPEKRVRLLEEALKEMKAQDVQ